MVNVDGLEPPKPEGIRSTGARICRSATRSMAEGKGVEPSRLITVATAFKAVCLSQRDATFRKAVKELVGEKRFELLPKKDWFLRPARLPFTPLAPLEDAARIELAIICFAGRPLTDWVDVR